MSAMATTTTTTANSASPISDNSALSPPTSGINNTQPKRRGHAHRRSAAISGDFDSMGISFFNGTSTNNSTPSLTSPSKSSFKFGGTTSFDLGSNKENEYSASNSTATMVPNKEFSFPNIPPPSSASTIVNPDDRKNNVSIKKSDMSLSTKYSVDSFSNEVSSAETTPENNASIDYHNSSNNINNATSSSINPEELNNRLNSQSAKYYLSAGAVLNEKSDVPEALIDLDAALDFNFDDSIKSKGKKFHRRTESAPEFDFFFNSSSFSYSGSSISAALNSSGSNTGNSNKLSISTSGSNGSGLHNAVGNRKSFYAQLSPTTDDAIFEEEEEEEAGKVEDEGRNNEDDELFQLPNNPLTKKPSIYSNTFSSSSTSLARESTSLNSESSLANSTDELKKFSLISPKYSNILQPPAPIGTRRGRTAARYQNYYDNSKLIIDALRSTESLNMKSENSTGNNNSINSAEKDVNHKMSLPILSQEVSSSLKYPGYNGKSVKASKSLSPTRFNFEPIVYDVEDKPLEPLKTYQEKANQETPNSTADSRPINEEFSDDNKSNNSYAGDTSMSSIGGSDVEHLALEAEIEAKPQIKSTPDVILNDGTAPLNESKVPSRSNSLHHRKSHSISAFAADDISSKISRPARTRFYKKFGSSHKNLNYFINDDSKPSSSKKLAEQRQSLSSLSSPQHHKRKSSVLSSLQQFLLSHTNLSGHSSNPTTSASSTRTIVDISSHKKEKSAHHNKEFDSLLSTPVLHHVRTHSRNNSKNSNHYPNSSGESVSTAKYDKSSIVHTPIKRNSRLASSSSMNLLDESQLSAQTITHGSQADLTITHPSIQKKTSFLSLASAQASSHKNHRFDTNLSTADVSFASGSSAGINTSSHSHISKAQGASADDSKSIIDHISSSYGTFTPKGEAKSLFKINTKSSLSLSLGAILKTPKKKGSQHFGDNSFGSTSVFNLDDTSIRSGVTFGAKKSGNKRSSKIFSWIKSKSNSHNNTKSSE